MQMASIHWIMCADEHGSSSMRVQAFPAMRVIAALGHETRVEIWRADTPGPTEEQAAAAVAGADLVVIAKAYGEQVRRFAIAAKDAGASVLLQVNGVEYARQPIEQADMCVTAFADEQLLLAVARRHPGMPIAEVPDPLERWLPDPRDCIDDPHAQECLWIGRARHLPSASLIALGLPDGWTLTTISDTIGADLLWDPVVAADLLARCQVLAITHAPTGNSAPIRLLNGLHCGKPVIATSVPSYARVGPPGPGRGWTAVETPQDVRVALTRLSDPDVRAIESIAAREAARRAVPHDPVPAWVEMIDALLAERAR